MAGELLIFAAEREASTRSFSWRPVPPPPAAEPKAEHRAAPIMPTVILELAQRANALALEDVRGRSRVDQASRAHTRDCTGSRPKAEARARGSALGEPHEGRQLPLRDVRGRSHAHRACKERRPVCSELRPILVHRFLETNHIGRIHFC
jgi:hypothetical protein